MNKQQIDVKVKLGDSPTQTGNSSQRLYKEHKFGHTLAFLSNKIDQLPSPTLQALSASTVAIIIHLCVLPPKLNPSA